MNVTVMEDDQDEVRRVIVDLSESNLRRLYAKVRSGELSHASLVRQCENDVVLQVIVSADQDHYAGREAPPGPPSDFAAQKIAELERDESVIEDAVAALRHHLCTDLADRLARVVP